MRRAVTTTSRRFTTLVALAVCAVAVTAALAIALTSHGAHVRSASSTHRSAALVACNGEYPGVCSPDDPPAYDGSSDAGNIIDE